MPFYIRKSFSAGPVRLNLSKSGLGVSVGVKGLRVGSGPRGSYVHGGRNGLYYRQQLSSSGRSSSRGYSSGGIDDSGFGCLKFIFIVAVIVLACIIINWIVVHATQVLIGVGIVVGIALLIFILFLIKANKEDNVRRRFQKNLDKYKEMLDSTFLSGQDQEKSNIADILSLRASIIEVSDWRSKTVLIESNVYQALLDKTIDDQYVSEEESKNIKLAEATLSIDPETKNRIKKEIFSAAYLQVIQDKVLTEHEINRITNLAMGLDIPDELINNERDLFYDLVRSQEISLPLPIIPASKVPINIPSTETVFYVTDAKVFESRNLRKFDPEKTFVIVKEGDLVITEKRIIVSDMGSLNIRLSDIAYIDIDLDTKLIEVTKTTSQTPIFIEVDSPFVVARIIDLIM